MLPTYIIRFMEQILRKWDPRFEFSVIMLVCIFVYRRDLLLNYNYVKLISVNTIPSELFFFSNFSLFL